MKRVEILDRVLSYKTPVIELTGGEPLLQPGALPLMKDLADAKKTVLIETSGERDISEIDSRVHRIVDLKAPSSRESHRIRWSNIEHLSIRDEVKLVLADRNDYEWARKITDSHRLYEKVGSVLFSPVFGVLEPQLLIKWIIEDNLPVRFQLQLHKIVWGPETQGV